MFETAIRWGILGVLGVATLTAVLYLMLHVVLLVTNRLKPGSYLRRFIVVSEGESDDLL